MNRELVIIGIVFIIVGGIVFLVGRATGNSWMHMMSPQYYNFSSMMTTYGVILIIAGFIVSVVGVAMPEKQKNVPVKKNETSFQKDEAFEILRIRYAKGEVSKEQFDQMKKDLEKKFV